MPTAGCGPVVMSPSSPACWTCRRGRPGCGSSCAANDPTPAPNCRCSRNATDTGYQAFVTNTATGQLPFLEARHRAHARVEDRIRHAKDSGLGRFPSRDFADLVAWLRLLALTGPLATAEPKALRYRLLHVPARLTRSARRRHLRIPATWPWVAELVAVFARVAAIPIPV
jgi:hypothetical protein